MSKWKGCDNCRFQQAMGNGYYCSKHLDQFLAGKKLS